MVENDTRDEEYKIRKDRVRGCNRKLYDLAQQLQKEIAKGRLGAKKIDLSGRGQHLLGLSVLVNIKRVMMKFTL